MTKEKQLCLPIGVQEKQEKQEEENRKLREEKKKLTLVVRKDLIQELIHIARRTGETPTRKQFTQLSLIPNTDRLISICFDNGFKELISRAELPPRKKKRKK